MAGSGQMDLDFDTLVTSYPTYNKLPPAIQKYITDSNAEIDKLNAKLKEGEKASPHNTPCCLQVSHALNQYGGKHVIGPRSSRPRANIQLPPGSGIYHVQAVDELEGHLSSQYGAGEEVKTKDRKDGAAIKAYLSGSQGILCFRNGGAGAHTELWDGSSIIQRSGAPMSNGAAISESYCWGQPRVVFWKAIGETPPMVVPDWLPGWWEVKDSNDTFYYYFFRFGTVHFTKNQPSPMMCPVTTNESSGTYTIDVARSLTINWNVGPLSQEVFTPQGAGNPPTFSGAHPNTPSMPFTARKIG
jgi:hypothetical protein